MKFLDAVVAAGQRQRGTHSGAYCTGLECIPARREQRTGTVEGDNASEKEERMDGEHLCEVSSLQHGQLFLAVCLKSACHVGIE